MKQIFNFFKTLLYGILPTLAGGCVIVDICYAIRHIYNITIGLGSGWITVLWFVFAVVEIILAFSLLHALGKMCIGYKKWFTYILSQDTDNINGGSETNETSDNSTSTSL